MYGEPLCLLLALLSVLEVRYSYFDLIFNGLKNEGIREQSEEWADDRLDEMMYRETEGRIGSMDRWMDRWIDEWTSRLVNGKMYRCV